MKNKSTLCYIFISVFVFSACDLYLDCDEYTSRSPESLLKENDYVMLGDFVGLNILNHLGIVEYLATDSEFMIVEYQFRPKKIYKTKNGRSPEIFFLWIPEHIDQSNNYSSIMELKKLQSYLIYGNMLKPNKDELINLIRPLTHYENLIELLQGKKIPYHERWNSVQADSLIALRIMELDTLNIILDQRNLQGTVLYGTDRGLQTFSSYKYGALCFYDEKAKKYREVKSIEYLKSLEEINE